MTRRTSPSDRPIGPRSARKHAASRAVRGAAVVAALGLLTACGPTHAGAAAIVGGDRLPVSQVQDEVQQISQEVPGVQPEGQAARSIVGRWVYGQLLDGIAQRLGVTVTQGEIDQRIAAVRAQAGSEEAFAQIVANAGTSMEHLNDLVRLIIQRDKIVQKLSQQNNVGSDPNAQEKAFLDALAKQRAREDVVINPRFGTLNTATYDVTPLVSGGLAQPGPGAAGSSTTGSAPAAQ